MSSPARLAAAAVAAMLAGGSFSKAINVERSWLPRKDLTAGTLTVSVIPLSINSTLASRNSVTEVITVRIVIMQPAVATADVDALTTLVDELARFLRFKRPPTYAAAAWIGDSIGPIAAPEALNERHQFTSALDVNYRINRSS